ncbi:Transmembrane protein 205 [Papilio xuthus]|nr:Transmembrane protein 205 [Papilio xuthus]
MATRTPQPLHISLALLVIAAWLLRPGPAASLRGWRALYVAAVATHLGAQIWMTLISGVVLYFSLPRHEFGRVQTVLFPVYYAFNAVVSLLAVLAYFRTQTLTHFQHTSWIQLALLLAVFSIEAYVRLRLVQPMLRAKHVKTQMEEAAGGGQEVGRLVMGELAHCPRYIRVLKTFRAYHSTIAMGTMIALGCSCYSTMIIVDSMCL